MSRVDMLGIPIDVMSRAQLWEAILRQVRSGTTGVFGYANVNAFNIAQKDEVFRTFLQKAAVVYCDGEGVRLGARILGVELPPRIVLTYAVWELCALCEQEGFSLYLLGSAERNAERAVARMHDRFPRLRIAGYHHGFFPKDPEGSRTIVERIAGSGADILFVGFGMPLQERWIAEHKNELGVKVILPCGSMIDYVAGTKNLAPAWMANHGLEWFFRLLQEPRRLRKRYLLGNPLFVIRILRQRVREGTKR